MFDTPQGLKYFFTGLGGGASFVWFFNQIGGDVHGAMDAGLIMLGIMAIVWFIEGLWVGWRESYEEPQ